MHTFHCMAWLATTRWWTLRPQFIFHPANGECVAIGECSKDVYNHLVYCKISEDIAVDSESKLLLTRAGRWFPFRHYTSSKTNFSLDIFQNVIGIFISGIFETEESHLKITVCPRHRDLFGTRWRCNKWRCSIPTSVGDRCPQVQGKILSPKGSIWIEKGAFSLCYERHEYACTSRLA